MKKFLVLYHAPVDAMQQTMNVTPEQQAKGMEAWMQWAQKCGDHLVDMGSPLMNGLQLSNGGAAKNSEKQVAGYSILQAENMEGAKSLMEGHPHISGWHPAATIELHETMALPGMWGLMTMQQQQITMKWITGGADRSAGCFF